VKIVLVNGAADYPLDEPDARWLETAIRGSVEAAGRLPDRSAVAALQVADVIAEDLWQRISDEPIELGRSHVDGLLAYGFHDAEADVFAHVAGSPAIAALYLGLRRYRGDRVRTLIRISRKPTTNDAS
jgi:hypothetical protein